MNTILFADDDWRIRQCCKEELEREGFRVLLVEDGADAIAAIAILAVDVVILDQHMTRCCGLETAARIRAIDARLPIILFTADEGIQQPAGSPVDAVVRKSADLDELKTAIQRALRVDRAASEPEGGTEGSTTRRNRIAMTAWNCQDSK
jgi:CheY-like chemotaxis protein